MISARRYLYTLVIVGLLTIIIQLAGIASLGPLCLDDLCAQHGLLGGIIAILVTLLACSCYIHGARQYFRLLRQHSQLLVASHEDEEDGILLENKT